MTKGVASLEPDVIIVQDTLVEVVGPSSPSLENIS